MPLLPAAATASEVMQLLERGYTLHEVLPGRGGRRHRLLKALAAPLPRMRFCPTGGIDAENARRYLALPNVVCVGGSWVTPRRGACGGRLGRIDRARARHPRLGVVKRAR